MSSEKKKLETKVSVKKQFSSSGTVMRSEERDEILEVNDFVTEPAMVRMSFGVTENLGNFESLRVEVSLSIPCYKEELNDAASYAEKWVLSRVLASKEKLKTDFSSEPALF